jgi:hypothetical protein
MQKQKSNKQKSKEAGKQKSKKNAQKRKTHPKKIALPQQMEAVNTHVQQAAAARRYFWPSGTEPLLSGPAKYLDPLCSCLPVHFQVSG